MTDFQPELDWLDAAAQGRLTVQGCSACDSVQHPPGPVCRTCGRVGTLGWRESSARGVVHSATVLHTTTYPEYRARVPYPVVSVRLDEGPYLLAGVEAGAVPPEVGDAVEVRFEERGGKPVPVVVTVTVAVSR